MGKFTSLKEHLFSALKEVMRLELKIRTERFGI